MCCLLQQKWDHWLPFTCAWVLGSSIWCDATCEGSCHPPASIMELPPSWEGGKQGSLMLMANGCSCLMWNKVRHHITHHPSLLCVPLLPNITGCAKYTYKHYTLRTLQLRESDQILRKEKFGLLLFFQDLVLLLGIVSLGSSFSWFWFSSPLSYP